MSIYRKYKRQKEQKEAKAYVQELRSRGKKLVRVRDRFGKSKIVEVDIQEPYRKQV